MGVVTEGVKHSMNPFDEIALEEVCSVLIRLITRVSVRYGEIFHEPKASEISRTTDECNKCFILIGTPPGSFSH